MTVADAALPDQAEDEVLLKGGREIARHIRKSERETYYLLANGNLPAFMWNGHWHMRPVAYRQFILRKEAEAIGEAEAMADA